MTDHVARLYALTASVLGLFLAWAGIAARPVPQAAAPSSPALVEYEQRLGDDAALVAQLVAARQARPAAPSVRVVTLPPLTTTRTS